MLRDRCSIRMLVWVKSVFISLDLPTMQLYSDRYIYYVCARELSTDLLLYEVNPDYGRLIFLLNKTLVFPPFMSVSRLMDHYILSLSSL